MYVILHLPCVQLFLADDPLLLPSTDRRRGMADHLFA